MDYKEGIQRKDWTKWIINSIQGMSYGAFYFDGQQVSEKELKELMADENVNFDYDDFVDYLNKNLNGDELGKLLKNNIVFPFGVTEVGMHCILDMEELQTYSSSVEEGKLIIHFDLCDNINDEVWNFGCKVIFNVEIPNYNMMLEKKSLKEANNELTWKFNSRNNEYIIKSLDCHYDNPSGFVLYNGSNKRIEILFDDLNTLVAKGYAKWTYVVGVGYILSKTSSRKEAEWYSIHTKLYSLEPWGVIKEKKSLKESNFKKSDAKVALQNVLKNGEEFDIPFKYSDEWTFTDAIEDELERRGFSFENSFRDKNYGSVEEYSDGLETVYVIMDRSLSSRGICVGLVTEL